MRDKHHNFTREVWKHPTHLHMSSLTETYGQKRRSDKPMRQWGSMVRNEHSATSGPLLKLMTTGGIKLYHEYSQMERKQYLRMRVNYWQCRKYPTIMGQRMFALHLVAEEYSTQAQMVSRI